MFSVCKNLETLSGINIVNVKSDISKYGSPLYACDSLRNFGGFKNCKVTYYADSCYLLSYESLLNMINGLADGVSGKTLYLYQDCVNMLSDSDIEIATNKGWSISPAKTITEIINVTDLSVIPSNTYQISSRVYNFGTFAGEGGNSTRSFLPCRDYLKYFDGKFSSQPAYLFNNCQTLREAKITAQSFRGTYLFNNCSDLRKVEFEPYGSSDDNRLFDSNYMFNNCYNIDTIDLSMLNAIGQNMSYMFYMCNNLTNLKLPDNFAQNATNISYMFDLCSKLENIEVSKMKVSNVRNMHSLFSRCTSLKALDLTG